MCPWGGRLMYGTVDGPTLRRLICHCLLIEIASAGLVLVDTGFGLGTSTGRASASAASSWPPTARNCASRRRRCAASRAMGFSTRDVRHIVVTHLNFDHAGGIEDFPHATVHVHGHKWTAATAGRRRFIARNLYRSNGTRMLSGSAIIPEATAGWDSTACATWRDCRRRSLWSLWWVTPGAIAASRSSAQGGGCCTPVALVSRARWRVPPHNRTGLNLAADADEAPTWVDHQKLVENLP